MGKILGLMGFAALCALACSSTNSTPGGTGNCQQLGGTYQGQTTCSNGNTTVDNLVAVQNGCTAKVTDLNAGGTTDYAISGNQATGSPTLSGCSETCKVVVTGTSYTNNCTASCPGQTISCSGGGTFTSSGSGGSGGSGGSSSGQCGALWTNTTPDCETCMETSCCSQLQNCAAGTPCGDLIDCISANCPNQDSACIQNSCSAELNTGSSGAQTLLQCNQSSCNSCR